ncbi:MAG TPA: nuclear transport factor 2 family protein [Caldimonas sp.]|nr:nuclear transport factor 2 family protein [Caldimonas sp.]
MSLRRSFRARARSALAACVAFAACAAWTAAHAQVPVTPAADQAALLASPDPRLAANKRFVYDFWREVFEGGHMDLAPRYMAEGYIQHNPNVPSGRAAFIEFFSKVSAPKPIEDRIKAPLVAMLADGDYVMLAFVREQPDLKDPTHRYTTTWFDLFRLEGGKIAEHWDGATKRP